MEEINVSIETVKKLVSAGNSDCAILYICRMASLGDDAACFSDTQLVRAALLLTQLGLNNIKPEVQAPMKGQEKQECAASQVNGEFKRFAKEVNRCLGRELSGEELEILASINTELHLPVDVLNVLIHCCMKNDRARNGTVKLTMHDVEQEAYHWAGLKIDTLEKAAAYIQTESKDTSRREKILQIMGITGRRITDKETQYIQAWSDMGFDDDTIRLAFEKTCENTGGLTWKYMSSVLDRWHNAGLHTVAQIRECDHKPTKALYKQNNGYIKHNDPPSPGMIEAVRRMMEDDQELD